MRITEPVWSTVVKYLPENNRMERIWKLAQIDFKKRYYNERLGLLWALINPLFQILVYFLVFTRVFNTRTENYALFLFCGFLIWGVFAEASKGGMLTLKSKIYLISNIQLSKMDLFISQTLSVFMGFFFNLLVYLLVSISFGIKLNSNILYFPIILISLYLTSVAVSMILSTILIYIDDIKHLWDMLLFLGFWGSGILFPLDTLIENFPVLLYLNPFLGLIENSRHAILDGTAPDFFLLGYNFIISLFLFIVANWIFRRNEHLVLEKA